MTASEVPVGPGKESYLHTLTGGPQDATPPVVMMPGYGAGVGFYYRCAWLSSQHTPGSRAWGAERSRAATVCCLPGACLPGEPSGTSTLQCWAGQPEWHVQDQYHA